MPLGMAASLLFQVMPPGGGIFRLAVCIVARRKFQVMPPGGGILASNR